MSRRYVVAVTFLGIAACATSGPESPVPGAKVESSVITSKPTAVEGKFEDVDVPEVSKMATIPAQVNISHPNALVCRREKITGSHRVTRVCRRRVDIDRRRAEDQETIRKIADGVRK